MDSRTRIKWRKARQANEFKPKKQFNTFVKQNNDLSNILSLKTLDSKEIKFLANFTAAK